MLLLLVEYVAAARALLTRGFAASERDGATDAAPLVPPTGAGTSSGGSCGPHQIANLPDGTQLGSALRAP